MKQNDNWIHVRGVRPYNDVFLSSSFQAYYKVIILLSKEIPFIANVVYTQSTNGFLVTQGCWKH